MPRSRQSDREVAAAQIAQAGEQGIQVACVIDGPDRPRRPSRQHRRASAQRSDAASVAAVIRRATRRGAGWIRKRSALLSRPGRSRSTCGSRSPSTGAPLVSDGKSGEGTDWSLPLSPHPSSRWIPLSRRCVRCAAARARNRRSGRYFPYDHSDFDATVRRPKDRLEPEPGLSLERRIRRDERDSPTRKLRGQNFPELRVEVAKAIALADSDAVRRVGNDPAGLLQRRLWRKSVERRARDRPARQPASRSQARSRSHRRLDPTPERQRVTTKAIPASALATTSRQIAESKFGQLSNANFLRKPGAIRRAINAPSIGMVPDPHIGSISGVSPRHPLAKSAAAASVSRIGAFPTA